MLLWGSWGCHTGQPHGLNLWAGLWDLVASSNGHLLPILAFQSLLVPRPWLCKGARSGRKSIQQATYPIQTTSYINGIARGQIWRPVHTCSWAHRWWIDRTWRCFFFLLSLFFVVLLLMCYIPICLVYRRRDICSFSFWTHVAKISLIDICIFEREGGYDSLSNAGDVTQQFNLKYHIIQFCQLSQFLVLL